MMRSMGWYTHGPNGMEYKYGDVLALAQATGLGQLSVVPRVEPITEDGDCFDDEPFPFLGPVQRALETRGLQWTPYPFDTEADPSGESIVVPLDVDPGALLDELRERISDHFDSVAALVEPEEDTVDQLVLGLEFAWTVDAEHLPDLVAWLNASLANPVVTEAALRARRPLPGTWYEPPTVLVEAVAKFARGDDPRHLAMHALAHTLASGETLTLFQPDDNYQEVVPRPGAEPRGVLLFRPEDNLALRELARALGVDAATRAMTWYAHDQRVEVELPPEPEVDPAQLEAGMALCRALMGLMPALPVVDRLTAEVSESEGLSIGWHPSASREDLERSFAPTGLATLDLGDVTMGPQLEAAGVPSLEFFGLTVRQNADPDDPDDASMFACLRYLAEGGEVPVEVPTSFVAFALYILSDPMEPEQVQRLGTLLRGGC